MDVGDVEGQPDLVVLRTEEGAPSFGGLAPFLPDDLPVWLDVETAGYPEDAVRARPQETLISVPNPKVARLFS